MPRGRAWLALLAVAAVALVATYALGSRRPTSDATVSPRNTAAPRRVVAPQGSPVPQGTAAPGSTAATPAPARMDEATFWRLVAETRAAAGNDTERQSELLDARLRRLPPRQIADFGRIRRSLDRQAYTWKMWGAAYVIEDGCSDDCFRDFRAYLISLGRRPFDTALRDPDALAAVVKDAETGDWENADDVAADAYQSVADEDIPGDTSELQGNPRGTPWDDSDIDALVQHYPRLAARFR
jgi:hypothetical protein